MNLIGGLFGQSEQEKINQQNIQQAQFMASNAIQMRVNDAKKAGINPLAALGSSFSPSPPQLVGSDALPNAIGAMGQNVSRAAQAYGDTISKSAELDNALKEAQIKQIEASTVDTLARASKNAQLVAPGSPPTLPYNWNVGGPVDPRPHKGMTALTQYFYDPKTGRRWELLGSEASQATMTSASLAPNAALNVRLGAGGAQEVIDALDEDVPRPDVWRSIMENPQNWIQ